MSATTDSVQRYWDKNATEFDSLYDSGSRLRRAFNAVFRKALFERIRIATDEIRRVKDATVLDVGCGSGRTTLPIAKVNTKHVTGVDFAPQMIDLAKRAASEAGLAEKCTFVVADFMSADLGGPFDYVTALGVFDYVATPVPFLRRMLELSRHGAIFSVPVPSLVRANLRKVRYGRHGVTVHFYEEEDLRRLGRDAGAASTRIVKMPAGYVVICQKSAS